ncbi:hypothetical protein F0562_017495 [Nyssa sinensis]|uniref:Exocyst subunit Exo70 family protein n=1 Tax=Nyssa sinensis TaxID=561372 RepID=A0A5J4ZF43_9ASTE|nr:hypothetical protein F0562_017495 [Nyssa sinensis]
MTQLEYEFEIILSRVTSLIGISLGTNITSSTYSSSITDSTYSFNYVDYDIDYNYSEHGPKIKESISDLRTIAERMNSAGHLRDCVKVYKSVRKSFLDENLRRLGIEKLSINEVRRLEWGVLEAQIGQFIRAALICVRILFPSEKQLCEQIFEGLGTGTADACFTEMVKDRAIQLFNFAEAIGKSRRPPQRLFKILEVHKKLSDLLPYIDSAFRSKSLRSVFDHAAGILPQLAESARRILLGFENDVLHELSDFVHHRGGIHPTTKYVMNYIIHMSHFKETLTKLIISMPSKEENRRYSNDLTILDIEEIAQFERERNALPAHLIWIIHILQLKLKIKSKSYNDTSLALLFMMNNVHYVVQKIQESPVLGEMIGDDYLEKLADFVRQGVTAYQTSTWEAIFHCLRDEGANQSRKNCSLGQRLKTFNAMFEEVHRTQATWSVPDLRLRKELRDSILAELIPAYRVEMASVRSKCLAVIGL